MREINSFRNYILLSCNGDTVYSKKATVCCRHRLQTSSKPEKFADVTALFRELVNHSCCIVVDLPAAGECLDVGRFFCGSTSNHLSTGRLTTPRILCIMDTA